MALGASGRRRASVATAWTITRGVPNASAPVNLARPIISGQTWIGGIARVTAAGWVAPETIILIEYRIVDAVGGVVQDWTPALFFDVSLSDASLVGKTLFVEERATNAFGGQTVSKSTTSLGPITLTEQFYIIHSVAFRGALNYVTDVDPNRGFSDIGLDGITPVPVLYSGTPVVSPDYPVGTRPPATTPYFRPANGYPLGVSAASSSFNSNSTAKGPRFAGSWSSGTSDSRYFRFDVPAGVPLEVRMALGRPSNNTLINVELWDGIPITAAPNIGSIVGDTLDTSRCYDAAGNRITWDSWDELQVPVQRTFANLGGNIGCLAVRRVPGATFGHLAYVQIIARY